MPESDASATRYVIGIGSQRAGSTLLHRVLSESTPVVMHPIKELHVFDTAGGTRSIEALHRYCRHLKDANSRSQGLARLGRRISRRSTDELVDRTVERTLDLLLGCTSAEAVGELDYGALFEPLAPEGAVLGEITPEYMLLRGDPLRRMYDTVGPETRIIMMRRDPVQRFISSFTLSQTYLGDGTAPVLDEDGLLQALDEQPGWMLPQWSFSDYDFALAEYRRVFPHVLDIELEHLVADPRDVAATLARFLGLTVDHDAVARVVRRKANSGVDFPVSDEVRATIMARLDMVKALRREAASKQAAGDS